MSTDRITTTHADIVTWPTAWTSDALHCRTEPGDTGRIAYEDAFGVVVIQSLEAGNDVPEIDEHGHLITDAVSPLESVKAAAGDAPALRTLEDVREWFAQITEDIGAWHTDDRFAELQDANGLPLLSVAHASLMEDRMADADEIVARASHREDPITLETLRLDPPAQEPTPIADRDDAELRLLAFDELGYVGDPTDGPTVAAYFTPTGGVSRYGHPFTAAELALIALAVLSGEYDG